MSGQTKHRSHATLLFTLAVVLFCTNRVVAQSRPAIDLRTEWMNSLAYFSPLDLGVPATFPAQGAAAFYPSLTLPYAMQLEQNNENEQGSIAGPIIGGVLGGTLGFFAGGLIGANAADSDEELAALGGFVLGATIGETIVMPLGVHIGNKGRRNLLADLLTSVGVVATGIVLANMTDGHGAVLPLTVVLQIGATVAVERSAGR